MGLDPVQNLSKSGLKPDYDDQRRLRSAESVRVTNVTKSYKLMHAAKIESKSKSSQIEAKSSQIQPNPNPNPNQAKAKSKSKSESQSNPDGEIQTKL